MASGLIFGERRRAGFVFADCLGGLCGQFDWIDGDSVGRWGDAASHVAGPGSTGWDVGSVNRSARCFGRA